MTATAACEMAFLGEKQRKPPTPRAVLLHLQTRCRRRSPQYLLCSRTLLPKDNFFWPVRGRPFTCRQAGEKQSHPPGYKSPVVLRVGAVSHIWMQPALKIWQLAQGAGTVFARPVSAGQGRGPAGEVKGHFISVRSSSANENISPLCSPEGFLQPQPPCD